MAPAVGLLKLPIQSPQELEKLAQNSGADLIPLRMEEAHSATVFVDPLLLYLRQQNRELSLFFVLAKELIVNLGL